MKIPPAGFPDNDALVYPDRGLRLSYLEFNAICDRVAKGLMEIGIKKGEHVAIWATNVAEWVALQFATAKIGAVLLTVSTSYKSAELEYILDQSDSYALFSGAGLQRYRLCGNHQRRRSRTQDGVLRRTLL